MKEGNARTYEKLRSNGNEFERFSTKTGLTINAPIDAFPKCPVCLSKRLIDLDSDVMCADCGWDSIVAFVEAGGFDIWTNAAVRNRVVSKRDKEIAAQTLQSQRAIPESHDSNRSSRAEGKSSVQSLPRNANPETMESRQ